MIRALGGLVLSGTAGTLAMGMALELGEESRQPLSQRSGPMCVVFSKPNQSGDALHLPIGHAHGALRNVYTVRRSWHGHFKGWSGRDVSWENAIHSAVVSKGAFLRLYINEGFSTMSGYYQMRDSQVSDFGYLSGQFKSLSCEAIDSSYAPRAEDSQSRLERYAFPIVSYRKPSWTL